MATPFICEKSLPLCVNVGHLLNVVHALYCAAASEFEVLAFSVVI